MTSHPEIAGARCECPACRIERLEAELAAANAKIEAARESDRIDLLLALGIESPKPTDNSESAT